MTVLTLHTRISIEITGVQMSFHNIKVTTTLSTDIYAFSRPVFNNSVVLQLDAQS